MVSKHLESVALAVLVIACWPIDSARAQPVSAIAEPLRAATVSLPCVLLRNDNVLFGRAHQVGEYVVVQTGQNGEIRLPRKEVACWADSARDLYRFRVDHRQKGNLAAHLRDARWCVRFDLFDLAAEEIRTINTIDPGNAEAKQIEDQLKRLTTPRQIRDAGYVAQPSDIQVATHEDEGPSLANVDLATLREFARRVQPTLLNRCSRCHSENPNRQSAGAWALVSPPVGARASSRMTRENLAACLQYIDRELPHESELLVKATTPHGGSEAPLDARNAKAVESLTRWITVVANALPNSQSRFDSDFKNHAQRQPDQANVTGQSGGVRPSATNTPFIAERPVMPQTQGSGDIQPERLPQVANPFDPNLFNRQVQLESIQSKTTSAR